jgi:hypothetical protein
MTAALIGKTEAQVAGEDDPKEVDAEQAHTTLNEGLKSCRSVVDNYREMLAGKRGDDSGASPEEPATDGAAPES